MNKQVIILIFFSVQVSAQNAKFPKLKISAPCNQEFLDSYKGKWLIPENKLVNSSNTNYSQAAMHRLNGIHELVKQAYPQPMGSDGYWSGAYRKTYFGYKIRYITENDRTQMEYVTTNQVEGWAYGMKLFAWSCSKNANEIWN